MSEIYEWNPVAANNNSPPPNGAPEGSPGTTPANINNILREMMASYRRYYDDPEFVNLTDAYTVSRPTSFVVRIAGVDKTALFVPGVPVQLRGGAAAQFGWVSISSFTGGNTDLTVLTFPFTTVDAATNEIRIAAARTLRTAAYYEVGNSSGQLPLVDDIPLICARARAFEPKEDADQTISGATGLFQITLNGLDYIAVPNADGGRDYQLSVCLQLERTATAGSPQFRFQIRLGTNGTTADNVIFEQDIPTLPVSTPGILTVSNLYIPNIPNAPGNRISFSLNKMAGAAGVGYVVKGKDLSGTPKTLFSFFTVEECL